jgi:hypothetical protein
MNLEPYLYPNPDFTVSGSETLTLCVSCFFNRNPMSSLSTLNFCLIVIRDKIWDFLVSYQNLFVGV